MVKRYLVFVMGLAYILAGFNHFWHPGFYTKILDGFLPYPLMLVYISGVAEMLCGLGLMIPATRKFAAWSLIVLLIAIFPGNIHMAMHPEKFSDIPVLVLYLRLPLQLFLIWWAYTYTRHRPK